MKSYPSITHGPVYGKFIHAFDKLDGSNVRVEWSAKRGFYKFGSRTRLVGPDDPIFRHAYSLIEQYGPLSDALGRLNVKKAMLFLELHGEKSFCGSHDINDDFKLSLFDVAIDNRGILIPELYLELTECVSSLRAKLLHVGFFDEALFDSIRDSWLPGMTFEGVVCKGAYVSPGLPLMFKVKSAAWSKKAWEHKVFDN